MIFHFSGVSKANDITTQASPPRQSQSSSYNSSSQAASGRGGNSNSSWSLSKQAPGSGGARNVSKVILATAALFFAVLLYKYCSLRPSPNILERIPVCPQGDHPQHQGNFLLYSESILTIFIIRNSRRQTQLLLQLFLWFFMQSPKIPENTLTL